MNFLIGLLQWAFEVGACLIVLYVGIRLLRWFFNREHELEALRARVKELEN